MVFNDPLKHLAYYHFLCLKFMFLHACCHHLFTHVKTLKIPCCG